MKQKEINKSVTASTIQIKTGSAENQQPIIGDNHLQNLSKTGSFLSHLARDLSGGRASSSSSLAASGVVPAMKSSSRNNSSGSNNSSGVAGRRVMRKQQQHSVSESSVCEEAREIDDVQGKSMATPPQPPPPTSNSNDTPNENEPNTVSLFFFFANCIKITIQMFHSNFFSIFNCS